MPRGKETSPLQARIRTRGGVLWGRREQSNQLEQLVQSIGESSPDEASSSDSDNGAPSHLALIHGPSGCGKTFLCQDVMSRFPTHRFLFGKYDQYRNHSLPYSALVQALESMLRPDREKGEEEKDGKEKDAELIQQVQESLGNEARILAELVPSFRHLITSASNDSGEATSTDLDFKEDSSNPMQEAMSSERLAVALIAFLRSVSTRPHPVVLILDDLQFADERSICIIQTLVRQVDQISNFLWIGIFRDDPDVPTTCLDPLLQDICRQQQRHQHQGRVHDIELTNLDQEQVSLLVLDILAMGDNAPSNSLDLVQLIHQRTLGNPHFIIEFLLLLQRRHLLTYNYATNQWVWNTNDIRKSTNVAENVVAALTHKVQMLPNHLLRTLQIAALLGFVFDVELLEQLVDASYTPCNCPVVDAALFQNNVPDGVDQKQSFSVTMDQAKEENLFEPCGKNLYRFSHDKLQESVYDLIASSKERDEIHWYAGKYTESLIHHGDPKMRSKYLLLAADQLNRGVSCISNESERLHLIQLNCEASSMTKQRNGLDLVGHFLSNAVSLVQDDDWRVHYRLTLRTYDSLVRFESHSTNMDDSGLLHIQTILKHARYPKDTINALACRSRIKMRQAQYSEAIRDGRKALRLCGEAIPLFFNKFTILREILRLKFVVRNKTDEELLNLPEMVSPHKKTALQILKSLAICGWQTDPMLQILVLLRFFRITLQHGRNRLMSTAFGAYACRLVEIGDIDGALRFAGLGLKAQRKEDIGPEFVVCTYTTVMFWKLPIPMLLEPFLNAYRQGLESGDTFFGGGCLTEYCMAYLDSGLRLDNFASDLWKFANQQKIMCYDVFLLFQLPLLQLAMNLTGQSSDPLHISWSIVESHGLFNERMDPKRVPKANSHMEYIKAFNAYILGDDEVARESMNRLYHTRKAHRRFGRVHMHNGFLNFLDGTIGFWLFLKEGKRKYYQHALRAMADLKKTQNLNTLPLLKLLEAQKQSLVRPAQITKVRSMYDEAIKMLQRSGLVHYGAIAAEQVGDFLSHVANDSTLAQEYYLQSADLFNAWGATVKVEQLVQTHILDITQLGDTGKVLRGRERFSVTRDTITASTKKLIQ